MSPSDKVTELMTETVSVVAVALDLFVFAWVLLFHVVHVCFIVVVFNDWNIDIDPVNNRLSCIFAIVSAGVVAPTCPVPTWFLGRLNWYCMSRYWPSLGQLW